MRFLQPDLANWLLALPVVFVFWYLWVRVKSRFRERAAIDQHLQDMSRLTTSAGDFAALALALVAVGFLVLSMMRPQLLLEMQVPQYEKHDLILMLDRSVSMYAQDIKPSRFSRAVDEIKTFLKNKPDTVDRVAIVGFAGTSLVLSRLTSDQSSLFFYLDWIKDDARLFFGTDIGGALDSAVQMAEKDWQENPKIFVVLSDGEDYGEKLSAELTVLQKKGIRVHTIGIGGEAVVPIPIMEQGKLALLLDENGKVMETRFSAGTLTNIASLTGGRYFRSMTGTELTKAIYDIVSIERKLVGWTATVEYRDLYREALMVAALATMLLLLKV